MDGFRGRRSSGHRDPVRGGPDVAGIGHHDQAVGTSPRRVRRRAGCFGTRETPGSQYLKRAVAGAIGVYGNNFGRGHLHRLAHGRRQAADHGADRYTIRIDSDKLPLVKLFWSITMYDRALAPAYRQPD